MFTPKLASRAKPSPLQSPSFTKLSQQRGKTSAVFTPHRKAPYTPRNRSLNASLQTSQIIEETATHCVESYGAPLPVLVTEALTLDDRDTKFSVQIDPSGWAWLVSGRKLFVWRFKLGKSIRNMTCQQLTLPPSDLLHQAALVNIIAAQHDHQATSAVAVSAEGIIRYWANITHEGSYVEISADLKGEECVSLTNLQPHGSILATTTSTLVQVMPVPAQNAVTCRTLSAPQGMLAGFSRRMSSFIFGSLPAQSTGASLQRVIAGEALSDNSQAFYVLSGSVLQKWLLLGQAEKLEYQCEAQRMFRECLAETIWGQDAAHLPGVKVWLLDLQLNGDGVMVLGAGVNTEASQHLYYAMGTISTSSDEIPDSFMKFHVSTYNQTYNEDIEAQLLDCHLLLPNTATGAAYIHNDNMVICPTQGTVSQIPDKVEFKLRGDKLLGAGCCENVGLFFSSVHGLVSVKSTARQEQSLNESSILVETHGRPDSALAYTPAQVEELSTSEDKAARLKAAFLHYCRGSIGQAQSIVEELFPGSLQQQSEYGSSLNTMVAALSRELVDDFPASDPRWAEAVSRDTGSSSASLIILHQLEDKQKAHEYLINFLTNVGILNRLSSMNVREQPMKTQLFLCEHAEKLVAAITLRNIHSQDPQLVDTVIRRVLESRGDSIPPPGLAPQDLFYREVSRIDEVFEALLAVEEEMLAADLPSHDMVTIVTAVNNIMGSMLHDAWQHRQGKNISWAHTEGPGVAFLPWTASCGPTGTRTLLTKQHGVTYTRGLAEASDAQVRGELFQQLVTLTDILLDGYVTQVNSTSPISPNYPDITTRYTSQRTKLIAPFLEHHQYERAAALAEKYQDFPTLVQICETMQGQDRLQRYMTQFHDQGFADYVFKWYRDEGKKGKLLSQPAASHAQLGNFLAAEENQYLSWLHDIHTNNLYQAHQTLKDLALSETGSLSKKKTLLSLSKLAALAADDPPPSVQEDVQAINDEHEMILHQELLPENVLQNLGMEPDEQRVLNPKELIEVYVSDNNTEANEFDFKKALDLLYYVNKDDPDYEVLRLHVWCQALLRDQTAWQDVQHDDPLDKNKDTLFFKTVELAINEGLSITDFLPKVDILLSAEGLGTLKDNTNFQYLIKAGYEHLERLFGDM